MIMLEQIRLIMKKHIGKRNAITSAEIADMLGINEDDTHATTRDLLLQAAEEYSYLWQPVIKDII